MTTFRKIKPSSIGNPYKGDYEYMLMWLSPTGGIRLFLFSSSEGNETESFKSSVIDTDADFRSIPNAHNLEVDLTTKSLSRESFEYVSSIFESNRVISVGKDSSITPVAIMKAKKKTQKIIKDFTIAFTISLQEPSLMNV